MRRHWLAVLGDEQFAEERLYARDTIAPPGLDAPAPGAGARVGDDVALVAAGELVALGRVQENGAEGGRVVRYTHRFFDQPRPAPAVASGMVELSAAEYERLVGARGPQPGRGSRWLVSVALPVEAGTSAEAVREFWTYVATLGPRELPAFVWPSGNELAMQAFVLGAETNLDPEEE